MRWLTYEAHDPDEARRREAALAAIDRWWSAFSVKESELNAFFEGERDFDVTAWMGEFLGPVHPNLMWEFGPGSIHPHRLTITPETDRHLRPLVQTVLERAPESAYFDFSAFRPAESPASCRESVLARTRHPLAFDHVEVAAGESNRVDVVGVFPRGYPNGDEDLAMHQTFVMIETLLGEEMLDSWVGNIDVAMSSPGKNAVSLSDFPGRFAAVRQEIVEALPDLPLHAVDMDEEQWSSFEREPAEQADYPCLDDVFVGVAPTRSVELLNTFFKNVPFDSSRFSRRNEVFCYVKIDAAEGLEQTAFADRGEVEDALNGAIRPEGFGCTFGGATGHRYSYLFLAVTRRKEAFDRVRSILQKGRIPKRSWILFFDSELAWEWIGIYPDSPPPPLPDFEE